MSKTKGFLKLKGTNDYSSEVQHNTRVNYVKSRAPIGYHKQRSHVDMKEAQRKLGITLDLLSKEGQSSLLHGCHAGACDARET
ncbi:hypothetical protein Tco_1195281 [Tanacetum coccineum]